MANSQVGVNTTLIGPGGVRATCQAGVQGRCTGGGSCQAEQAEVEWHLIASNSVEWCRMAQNVTRVDDQSTLTAKPSRQGIVSSSLMFCMIT